MTAEMVRRALLRALLVGGACAGAFAFPFHLAAERSQVTLGAAVSGAFLGVLAGIVSLVELRAEPGPGSPAPAVKTAARVLAAAVTLSPLAFFQVAYTVVVL